MRVIKIDAVCETVLYRDIPENDINIIQTIIGCDLFTCVYPFDNTDALYVDDEGIFTDKYIGAFVYKGNLYFGSGLIIGTNENGESTSCLTDLSIKDDITFLDEETYYWHLNRIRNHEPQITVSRDTY